MINSGIIGLGRMGASHFAIAKAHSEINLTAACEPSSFIATAIEKYSGISCYKDYKKMIDMAGLDCVFITTPTRFHYEMVKYAVEKGLHVFVEKPFCLNPNDAKILVDIAEQKKVVNQVGYHNRFIGTFREAKRLLDVKAIGDVYHISGEAYGPVVLKKKGGTWRSDTKEGGGCLYDYAAHVINLMQYFVGSPTGVGGSVLQKIYSAGVDDAVYSTFYFQGDISGQIAVNWSDEAYRKMSTQITILGRKGKVIADAQELKVYLREQPTENGYETGWNMRYVTDLSPEIDFYLRGEEYSAQIEYFFECIKTNEMNNINSFASAHDTDCVIDFIKKDAGIKENA